MLATPLVRRLALALGAIDVPEDRKVHTRPIPRLGGLAVAGATLVAAAGALGLSYGDAAGIVRGEELRLAGLLGGFVLMVGVGARDDVRSLPAGVKLCTQIAAAALLLVTAGPPHAVDLAPYGPRVELGPWGWLLGLLWVVAVVNAFNMADGLDGLAVGLGLLSAGALAGAGMMLNEGASALVMTALCGALLGFLPHNFPRARVFLGDSGSLGVGFLLAAVSLSSLERQGAWLVFSAGLALAIPLADCSFAVLRRVWRAIEMQRMRTARVRYRFVIEKPIGLFAADRRHLHHRLLDLGFSARRAVVTLWLIAAACGLTAVAAVRWGWVGPVAGALVAALAAYFGPHWLYQELRLLQRGTLLPLLDMSATRNRALHALFDAAAGGAAFALALLIIPAGSRPGFPAFLAHTGLVGAATVIAFWAADVYRPSYRHPSVSEALVLLRAGFFATVLSAVLHALLFGRMVPVAGWVLHGYLLLSALLASRLSFRLFEHMYQRGRSTGRRVLIYGAGRAGDLALREILANPARGLVPLGFVDDLPGLSDRLFCGYRVYPGSQLEQVLVSLRPDDLVISTRKIGEERVQMIKTVCQLMGVRVLHFELVWGAEEAQRADAGPAGERVAAS